MKHRTAHCACIFVSWFMFAIKIHQIRFMISLSRHWPPKISTPTRRRDDGRLWHSTALWWNCIRLLCHPTPMQRWLQSQHVMQIYSNNIRPHGPHPALHICGIYDLQDLLIITLSRPSKFCSFVWGTNNNTRLQHLSTRWFNDSHGSDEFHFAT